MDREDDIRSSSWSRALKNMRILHGDVTPSNIFVLEEKDPKSGRELPKSNLADFGGAQHCPSDADFPQVLPGTRSFSAPEIDPKWNPYCRHTFKSDIWSFGLSCIMMACPDLSQDWGAVVNLDAISHQDTIRTHHHVLMTGIDQFVARFEDRRNAQYLSNLWKQMTALDPARSISTDPNMRDNDR